ncbi:MAG TPA: cation:proton antiporter, partial [Flavitalea sp.]|nr:cation:proton antiporter [Flavitalea sp.]
FLLFHVPTKLNFLVTRDGFVALSTTLLVYGSTELVHGYGFIAVFVAAVTLRNYEIGSKYHLKLHSFIDEMERTLLAIVLILFGGALVNGILDHLTWKLAGVGLLFLFVIRPVTAFITLSGSGLHLKEKAAISFFGIRGMGSFFYLAFAISQTDGFRVYDLWALVSFIVLMSVVIHGFTASSIMTKLSEQFNRKSAISADVNELPRDTDPAAPAPGIE